MFFLPGKFLPQKSTHTLQLLSNFNIIPSRSTYYPTKTLKCGLTYKITKNQFRRTVQQRCFDKTTFDVPFLLFVQKKCFSLLSEPVAIYANQSASHRHQQKKTPLVYLYMIR